MADNKELILKLKTEYQDATLKQLEKDLRELKSNTDLATKSTDDYAQKVNFLSGEINKQRTAFNDAKQATKMSGAQLLEWGENLSTVIQGIQNAIGQIAELGKGLYDIGLKGAEFGNLKAHFNDLNGGIEKSNEYLNNLKSAAAGGLNDAELIKYSNKMQDLGYSTDQVTQFLDIAERTSDNLGITIEEGNSNLLSFIETGRGKGLKEMGISVSDVKAEMDKLAKAQDININKTDEETQKRIRSEAVLKLYGKSLDSITTKEKDNADKLQSLSVAFENAKLKIGELVGNVLSKLADLFGTSTEKIAMFVTVAGALATAITGVTAAVWLLNTAMVSLNISSGGLLTVLGLVVSVAALVAINFGGASKSIAEQRNEMLKSEPVNESTKKMLDELDISASNMAEAYKGIESAIYGMTEAQTKSAMKFVDAEIAKIEALKETGRQMDYNNMRAKGLEDYDIQNQTHQMQIKQYEDVTFGADLEKLYKIQSELNTKIGTFDNYSDNNGDKIKTRVDKEKEELTDLNKIDKEIADKKVARERQLQQLISNGYSEVEAKSTAIMRKYDEEIAKLKKDREDMLRDTRQDWMKIYNKETYGVKKDTFDEKRELKKVDKELAYSEYDPVKKYKNMQDTLIQCLDVAGKITNVLGLGADSFVSKLINGLNQGLDLANSIVSLLEKLGANVGSGGIFGVIGSIFGFAEGGYFRGNGNSTSDSNLIRISNGEYIVNANATKQYKPFLDAINFGKYANGGMFNNLNKNINNVYLNASVDGLSIVRSNYPIYKKQNSYRKI